MFSTVIHVRRDLDEEARLQKAWAKYDAHLLTDAQWRDIHRTYDARYPGQWFTAVRHESGYTCAAGYATEESAVDQAMWLASLGEVVEVGRFPPLVTWNTCG